MVKIRFLDLVKYWIAWGVGQIVAVTLAGGSLSFAIGSEIAIVVFGVAVYAGGKPTN
jgi:hypothetical protein